MTNEDANGYLPSQKSDQQEGAMAGKDGASRGKGKIDKARKAATSKRTIAHLPEAVRSDLGRQGAKARARGGKPGHRLEDRNRQQLYELAKERNIAGRSRMGKWELIDAIRSSR
jgi:hypothetical protein